MNATNSESDALLQCCIGLYNLAYYINHTSFNTYIIKNDIFVGNNLIKFTVSMKNKLSGIIIVSKIVCLSLAISMLVFLLLIPFGFKFVYFPNEKNNWEMINVFINLFGFIIAGVGIVVSAYLTINSYKKNSIIKNEEEIRKMKQDYYNSFIEIVTERMNDIANTNLHKKFLIECNRLNLYASKEVIEFINAYGYTKEMSTEELFKLIRKDIFNNELEEINYNLKVTDRAQYFNIIQNEEYLKFKTGNQITINNTLRDNIIFHKKILNKIEKRVADEFDTIS